MSQLNKKNMNKWLQVKRSQLIWVYFRNAKLA